LSKFAQEFGGFPDVLFSARELSFKDQQDGPIESILAWLVSFGMVSLKAISPKVRRLESAVFQK
jgi:hypothetical protein